jgi:hypothetical protein
MMTGSTSPSQGPSRPVAMVELVVKLSAPLQGAGKPVRLTTEIRNGTDREVTVWQSGFWPNHRVVVTDEADQEPPLTAFGKTCRAAFDPNGDRDKNSPHIVRPGESWTGPGCDLNALYDFKPGIYHVFIVYEDQQKPTPLKLTSDVVAFQLK